MNALVLDTTVLIDALRGRSFPMRDVAVEEWPPSA